MELGRCREIKKSRNQEIKKSRNQEIKKSRTQDRWRRCKKIKVWSRFKVHPQKEWRRFGQYSSYHLAILC
jgi:hypothetical protein